MPCCGRHGDRDDRRIPIVWSEGDGLTYLVPSPVESLPSGSRLMGYKRENFVNVDSKYTDIDTYWDRFRHLGTVPGDRPRLTQVDSPLARRCTRKRTRSQSDANLRSDHSDDSIRSDCSDEQQELQPIADATVDALDTPEQAIDPSMEAAIRADLMQEMTDGKIFYPKTSSSE